jgi:outer membrane receptor protein involved in Fe transport
MTKIGLLYDNPDLFSLGIFLTNVGERYGDLENSDTKKLGAYQVLDVKISRRLIKGMEAYCAVNNLTDEEYKEYYTTYNPPLTILAGVSYKF